MKTCKQCKGRGQTKRTRTEFHFVPKKLPDGKIREQYVTDKLGSGCPGCHGRGVVS